MALEHEPYESGSFLVALPASPVKSQVSIENPRSLGKAEWRLEAMRGLGLFDMTPVAPGVAASRRVAGTFTSAESNTSVTLCVTFEGGAAVEEVLVRGRDSALTSEGLRAIPLGAMLGEVIQGVGSSWLAARITGGPDGNTASLTPPSDGETLRIPKRPNPPRRRRKSDPQLARAAQVYVEHTPGSTYEEMANILLTTRPTFARWLRIARDKKYLIERKGQAPRLSKEALKLLEESEDGD